MSAAARDAIFDLAVNRAARFLHGTGQRTSLEVWHSKTRFATRVELDLIRVALEQRPSEGEWFWVGGELGSWQKGKARTP